MENIYEPGNILKVVSLDYTKKSGKKLLDMGITPGTEIKIIGMAPLGEPLVISAGGYTMAVRRKDLSVLNLSRRRENLGLGPVYRGKLKLNNADGPDLR